MLVPVKWIKDYVDIDANAEEYGDTMTMAGITLETVRYFGKETEKVVVGKIEKIEKHPDADKLDGMPPRRRARRIGADSDGSDQRLRGSLRTGGSFRKQNTGASPRTAEKRGRSKDISRQTERSKIRWNVVLFR